MRKYVGSKKVLVCFSIMVMMLFACDDGENNIDLSGDFYPMKKNTTWQYISEWGCGFNACNEKYPNWFQYVLGDTTIQNKRYTIIRGVYDVAKIARREGDRYYEWHIYDEKEYVFLDAGRSPGESWVKDEHQYWKTEVFVEEPMNMLRVKEKVFYNVIVMREEVSYDDDTYSSKHITHRYYAKDIGEVLAVAPAVPNTYHNGSVFSLFKYER